MTDFRTIEDFAVRLVDSDEGGKHVELVRLLPDHPALAGPGRLPPLLVREAGHR